MTAIAKRSPQAQQLALPQLPQPAEELLRRILRDGQTQDDATLWGELAQGVPGSVRLAAQRALPAYAAQCQPAAEPQWRAFLLALAAAVRNPPAQRDVERFAAVCAATLDTIPGALLDGARIRAACRHFAFWPGVADIAAWLEPDAKRIHAEAAALRRMAAAREAPEHPPISPEERASVGAQLKTLAGQLHAEAAARHRAERKSTEAVTKPMEPMVLAEIWDLRARQAEDGGDHRGAKLARQRAARLRGDPEADAAVIERYDAHMAAADARQVGAMEAGRRAPPGGW